MKKIIRNKEIIKATRKFTDRELPRKVFWDKYEKMKQNINNLEDIYIITYYGVGGIGKSTLLRKIIEELKEKEEKPYYVLHDFENAQDAKGTLLMLKNKLEEAYKFEFPLFDLALYAYAKKIGESAEKPEVQSFIGKSKILSLISDGATEIPVVGIAAKVLKYADSTVAILRSASKNNKEDLLKIEQETDEETYRNLPYYFSQDLMANIEKLGKPLVILLDTYEKLVNELSDEGYSIMKDLWLRSDNGPILQVPGVLWVIAGREKIKWGEYDKDWEDTLEQHILGDLSFNDANEFLENAGVVEADLRKQIYDLTNGTPVYLDICVDTYELLKNRKEEPTIDKFGINIEELVERYIRYMDVQTSEMVYMLSNIDNWNDKMIQKFGGEILPNFSIVLYNKVKDLSFILEDNNSYYMHKTVKNIFQKECPEMIKNKAIEVLNEYYYDTIDKMSAIDEKYEAILDRYLENVEKYFSILNTEEDLNDEIYNMTYILNTIVDHATIDLFLEESEKMYQRLYPKYHEKEAFYHMEMLRVSMLYEQGENYEAKEILEKMMDKMIANNDYSQILLCHEKILSIYQEYPDYAQMKKLMQWIEKCDIQKHIVYYIVTSLNRMMGNTEYTVELIEKKLEDKQLTVDMRGALLVDLIRIFLQNDYESKYIEKYKKYIAQLEELIKDETLRNHNIYIACYCVACYYCKKENNYEKAYVYVNQMEKRAENYIKQFSYNEIQYFVELKIKILNKLNKEQELQEFCNKWYQGIVDELDNSNVTVNKMKLILLKQLGKQNEIKKIYTELEERDVDENSELEKLYSIADIANDLKDEQQTLKVVNQALEIIKRDGLSDKNIAIFEKINFEILICLKIENSTRLQYLEQLCSYYEQNCAENYEEVKRIFLKVNAICERFGEEKQGRNYLDRLRVITIEKKGEKSVEIAKIDNQIGNSLDGDPRAISYYENAYKIYKEVYGEEDLNTIVTCVNKIYSLVDIDYASSIKDLEEYYEMISKKEVTENNKYHILKYLIQLKRKYNYRVSEIKKPLEELLNYYIKMMGDNSESIQELIEFLNPIYKNANVEEAEEIAIEYNIAIRELLIKMFDEYNNNVLMTEESLAGIYYTKKEYEKALKIYQTLYEKEKKLNSGEDNINTISTLRCIVLSEDALGKKEEATKKLETLKALANQHLEETDTLYQKIKNLIIK